MFLSDEHSDIIQELILRSDETKPISRSLIVELINKCTECGIENIQPELVDLIKVKFLFTGIQEGWLLNEKFE
jgi:hypothetical protein